MTRRIGREISGGRGARGSTSRRHRHRDLAIGSVKTSRIASGAAGDLRENRGRVQSGIRIHAWFTGARGADGDVISRSDRTAASEAARERNVTGRGRDLRICAGSNESRSIGHGDVAHGLEVETCAGSHETIGSLTEGDRTTGVDDDFTRGIDGAHRDIAIGGQRRGYLIGGARGRRQSTRGDRTTGRGDGERRTREVGNRDIPRRGKGRDAR